jgi:hypothetical protein
LAKAEGRRQGAEEVEEVKGAHKGRLFTFDGESYGEVWGVWEVWEVFLTF